MIPLLFFRASASPDCARPTLRRCTLRTDKNGSGVRTPLRVFDWIYPFTSVAICLLSVPLKKNQSPMISSSLTEEYLK